MQTQALQHKGFKLDPRTKLLLMAVVSTAEFLYSHVAFMIAVALIPFVLLISNKQYKTGIGFFVLFSIALVTKEVQSALHFNVVLNMIIVLLVGLAGCGDPGQGGTQPTGDQASPEGAVGQSQVQADPSSSAQTNANSDRTLYGAANQVNTTFDPWGVINSYDNLGRIQVFNTLVFKNDAGKIVGSLAKDWEWSEDAMQITFNLHQGVKFHNGEELKASDVKFSLDTARQSPTCATYLTSIEHIETPDDYTVIVKLNKPNVALLEVLMTFGLIVHEGSYSAAGDLAGDTLESVIGTGPYRLTEWKPTEIMVFESFDDYFEGAPSIKNLSIKTISDPNTAIIALQTGDIDIYFQSVPAISIGTLKSNDSLTVVDITSKRLFYMGINWEFGPFASNPKLREAVAYGVDRNALNMIANEGLGTIVYYPGGPDYSGQPNVKNTGKPHPKRACPSDLGWLCGKHGSTVCGLR